MTKLVFSAMALLLGVAAGCGSNTPSSTDKCATVTCGTGQYCDGATGSCRAADKCMGITCDPGESCDGATGTCVTLDRCSGITCTNGQVCSSVSGTCTNPLFPQLGIQIDRMGRPAVNTALTNPFDLYNGQTSDETKAIYNADASPSTWNTTWGSGNNMAGTSGPVGLHMAIIDGLDGTCANQFAYGLGSTLGFSKYGLLNLVLSNDALHLDSSQGTCSTAAGAGYLSVEIATATGTTNADCGGRKLEHDVIDITYSALARNGTTGVMDNIAQTSVPSATFPFLLAAP